MYNKKRPNPELSHGSGLIQYLKNSNNAVPLHEAMRHCPMTIIDELKRDGKIEVFRNKGDVGYLVRLAI